MSKIERARRERSLSLTEESVDQDLATLAAKEARVPKPGTVVASRYRVVALLGEGGMGVVMETEHLELGIRVALKLLDPVFSHDPEYSERFKREARTASRLGHQNVVRVLDLGVAEDGRLYYAMELVEGEHLGDVIEREGALDPERATRIMLQVCDALGAAHERNVIHRDLKPENILMTKRADGSDFVRLTDFGIALQLDKAHDRLTKTGRVLGTPHYMAPEQVARRPVDARTDVYSVGMVLYELLTGTPPFNEGEPVEIMTDQLRTRPEKPRKRAPDRGIPPVLEDVVMRAIEKKPDDRHQSIEDFAVELWAALVVMGPQHALGRPPSAAQHRETRHSHTTVPRSAPRRTTWSGRLSPRRAPFWVAVAGVLAVGAAVGVVVGSVEGGAPVGVVAGSVEGGAPARLSPPPAPPEPPVSEEMAADDEAPEAAGSPLALLREDDPPDESEARPGAQPDQGAVSAGAVSARAEAAVERSAARRAPATADLLAEASAALRRGDAAEAARRYRQAVRRAPGNAAAHAGLAQAEFQLGDNAAAARHFERAVRLRPANVRYRMLYGGALERIGRQGAARAQYEAVLRNSPDHAAARRRLERL